MDLAAHKRGNGNDDLCRHGRCGYPGFAALGLLWSLFTDVVFGALGGVLGALTLRALRKARFFDYLAERR